MLGFLQLYERFPRLKPQAVFNELEHLGTLGLVQIVASDDTQDYVDLTPAGCAWLVKAAS